MIQSKPK